MVGKRETIPNGLGENRQGYPEAASVIKKAFE
jgi:hypothetical protein